MRFYSREFRLQIVKRILNGEKVPALSQELGIHRKLLYEWVRRVLEGGESSLRERGRPRKIENAGGPAGTVPRKIAELERSVAQQQLVIEFFQGCLAADRVAASHEKRDWRGSIFQTIQAMMERQGGLRVEMMCELAGVTRSGYYRYLRTRVVDTGAKRNR